MSSPAWHKNRPVWHVTYSGGMEYWRRGIPEVQLFFPTVTFLDAVAALVGSSEVTPAASSILSPVAKLNGDSIISPNGSLLIAPRLVLEGNSVLIAVASTRVPVRAYLLGDSKLIASLAHVTVIANTRILSGSLILLDVLADVRGAYPWAAVRQGRVHPTFAGPVPQYGSVKRPDIIVEVDIPIVDDSQIATIGAMLRGDYGSVFTIEAPRETFQASLIPGNEGVAVEVYPSAPGSTKAKVVLRFVKVVS